MITLNRHIESPGRMVELRPESLDVTSAVKRLVIDWLEDADHITGLNPDRVALEIRGRRRLEYVQLVGWSHIMRPLVLITRQYLLVQQSVGDPVAVTSMIALNKTMSIFHPDMPHDLPDPFSLDLWRDQSRHDPLELALVLALMPGSSLKRFESLVRLPLDQLIEVAISAYEESEEQRIGLAARTALNV